MSSALNSDEMSCPIATFPMARTDPFHPPPEYARLRAESAIVRARMQSTGNDIWLVTRYEEAKIVLSDTRFSSDPRSPGFPVMRPPSALMGMDPPEHTEYRRILQGEFSSRRIGQLKPVVERLTQRLLDDIERQTQPVDLIPALALQLPSLVMCLLLGVGEEDHQFLESRTLAAFGISATAEEMRAAVGELRAYITNVVTVKAADPGDDLISRLIIEQVRPGILSEGQVADIAGVLLFAGLITTVNMIGLGILTLLRHPDQAQALRQEPALIGSAVNELLRHLSVTATVSRVATHDTEIGGTKIRSGDGVMVLLSSANRDELAFDDADRFDIGRGERGNVAFGNGPHLCLGAALARMELQVVIGAVLQRFPSLRLAVDLERIPFRLQETIYGVYELPVTWEG
ncbi:cytochrome P450 [Nocardia sp. NPDC048505]|uniref:cytochrome P450 n=1 Tax=Nocardia sp. NPDC048505 TaxID=3155756 RepID=UPI0033D55AEA